MQIKLIRSLRTATDMQFHQIFSLITTILITAAAGGQSLVPEQLFLDLPVAEVLNRTAWNLVEPWATEYCTAIAEQRYGDAIYARYNIHGDTKNGMLTLWDCTDEGSYREWNITVYEQIMEDARGYYDGHPDLYQEALEFYSSNSPNDSRGAIIEALNHVMNNGSDF